MNGKYLLDTNVIIDLFKQDENLSEKIAEADAIFVSVVSIGELYYGAYKSTRVLKHLQETKLLEQTVSILQPSTRTADFYGQIKSQLKKKGRPIPENDIWIAANALEHNLTLLTRDKHFLEIEDLSLELWASVK